MQGGLERGVGIVKVGGGLGLGGWYFGVGGWLGWWGGFEVGGSVLGVGGWLSARFASRGRVAGRIGDAGS